MNRSGRPPGGGPGPAWGVVAVASGGGAVITALGGVATGHPLGGLAIAGCVLIAPWILALVPVIASAVVAVRRAPRRRRDGDEESPVEVIDALRRVIETILGR